MFEKLIRMLVKEEVQAPKTEMVIVNRSKAVDDYFLGVKGFNVLERQTAKAVLIKERELIAVE